MYTGERRVRDVLTDTDVGEAVLEFIVRSGSYGNGLICVGGQSLQSTAISVTAVSVMPVGVRKGDDTHRHTPMLDQPLIPRQFLGGNINDIHSPTSYSSLNGLLFFECRCST